MNIVGELINASRKTVRAAIEAKDVDAIQAVAREQAQAGATFIDVNAGVFADQEVEYLPWLVTTVQAAVDTPCCIDSPNPAALEAAVDVHRGTPLINSISLESSRFEAVLRLVTEHKCKVVALCMSDDGMPETPDQRVTVAEEIVGRLVRHDVKPDDIYVDLLVQPISTDGRCVQWFLDALRELTRKDLGVHTICGLSNVSFGLPQRKILNRTFAAMAISHGLDTAICSPLDKDLASVLITADALAGRDEYCERYLDTFR